ncbi:MAG: endonuclease/exonuclease/phosphatase family protein [Deltaproteobacteria bacterium]|nr:endonuclease/exonuclease/phosphatase family protein [Deltaproteobacteria bacterium]
MPFLSVLTFNLRHGWADDGAQAWAHRRKAVAALLARQGADIIGFQEVNDFQFDFLIDCLPGHRPLGDRRPHGERWEFRPVFVRATIKTLEVETLTLSATPNRLSRFRGSRYIRQATRVLFRFGGPSGPEAVVYNTHLDFTDQVQLRQAAVIWKTIRERDLDRPAMLMGDFNGTPAGSAYRFLTGRMDFGDQRGDFKDAMSPPQPHTHHGFTGRPQTGYLDWILYRGSLVCQEPAEVLEDSYEGLYPSDHFPVRAVLAVKGWSRRAANSR